MKLIVLTAAASLALSPFAYAQTVNAPAPKNENVQQQVKDSLQKAGFTDIQIRPESFFVNAKDKSGNPVMITVDPNSIEEVTIYPDKNAGNHNKPTGAGSQPATANNPTGAQ